MLFSDPIFFAFFACYFALHLVIPPRVRVWLIIVGSTVFYAWWRPIYVWVPYLLTTLAIIGTPWIDSAKPGTSRRRRLGLVLLLVFLPLAVIKYAYFITHDVLLLGGVIDTEQLRWNLPLGISFITFTLSAYIIDVYRGRYPLERSPATVFAYVLFFPHLIAGPILRPHELMPQFKQLRPALGARFTVGIAIFSLGLLKKLVFADQIAEYVDRIYAGHGSGGALEYIIAIYGFSAQIYCDFSGYTDMAIGLAYLLRIRLPTNFLRPYTALSVIEFWHRWHITLSHWLRDYLYIPVGGNRGGKSYQFRNIMITMLLGGLWHGANWTFVIWGFLHGLFLGLTHLLQRPLRRRGFALPKWLALLLTFHFVTFAWIFFRARDLAGVRQMLDGAVFGQWNRSLQILQQNMFVVVLILIFGMMHYFDRHAWLRLLSRRMSPYILWPAIALCWVLAITVSQGSSAKFIYFDF